MNSSFQYWMFGVVMEEREERPPVEKTESQRVEMGRISGGVRQDPQGGGVGVIGEATMRRERRSKRRGVGRVGLIEAEREYMVYTVVQRVEAEKVNG